MADSGSAGDEDHGDWGDASHEERVVIGAADHWLAGLVGGLDGLFDGREDGWIAGGGWVGVDCFEGDADAATVAD